jgi:hypothetical protein
MASQSWVSLLNPASPQASGAGTLLNTASTATLSPLTGAAAISDVAQVQPAGQPYGWYPGLLIRVTAQGTASTGSTATNLTVFLGTRVGNSGSTVVTLATSAAIAIGTASLTGLQWNLEALIRCTGIAVSGSTVSTQGTLTILPVTAQTIGTATADTVVALPNASGETATAVDTTQLQGLSLNATLSAAHGSIQLTQWLVEALD